MEKAYAKFGAWRASVRDTRLKDVMVRKGQKVSKKKRTKKEPLVQKPFFSLRWSHFDTLTRTSEPSQREPRLDLLDHR